MFIPVALPPDELARMETRADWPTSSLSFAGESRIICLRLATSPNLTGSSLLVNTIGIVPVAALAANADPIPPVAAMTLT
jgi:hypothetical protein